MAKASIVFRADIIVRVAVNLEMKADNDKRDNIR